MSDGELVLVALVALAGLPFLVLKVKHFRIYMLYLPRMLVQADLKKELFSERSLEGGCHEEGFGRLPWLCY